MQVHDPAALRLTTRKRGGASFQHLFLHWQVLGIPVKKKELDAHCVRTKTFDKSKGICSSIIVVMTKEKKITDKTSKDNGFRGHMTEEEEKEFKEYYGAIAKCI